MDSAIITNYDIKLKTEADLTMFVNRSLFTREFAQCRRVIYLDHSVDYQIFATAGCDQEISAEIVSIPRLIAALFGRIDGHTSDIGLRGEVVRMFP